MLPNTESPGDVQAVTVGGSDRRLSRICVVGNLDAKAAACLIRVCDSLMDDCRRLELDLSNVTSSTTTGISALARCVVLGRRLPDGVGVTVANDVGRRALLASMADI